MWSIVEFGFFALAERGCTPFADAIQSHDRRLLERRQEECAGGMGLMVAAKINDASR
jgi:hypothetical protein